MFIRLLQYFISFLFLTSLVACDSGESHLHNTDTLIFCAEKDPGTLNPQISSDTATLDATSYILFDRLLEADPITQKLQPSLATSWKVEKNNRQFTFTLRRSVQFHTTAYFQPTRSMTSEDVVYSFTRIMQGMTPSQKQAFPLFNRQEFKNIKSIRALNDHKVQFELYQPESDFLKVFTLSSAVILSKEYFDQLKKHKSIPDMDLMPIGTGPFKLDKYNRYVSIRYIKNEGYWKKDSHPLNTLIFDITTKNRNRLAKLLQNDCDIVSAPKMNDLPQLVQDKRFSFRSMRGLNTTYLAINTTKPPFDKVNIRKAIAHGINRQDIVKSIFYYTAQEAHSLLPPVSWAYSNAHTFYAYQPDFSRYLLEQQGIKNLKMNLWVNDTPNTFNPSMLKTAQIIQASLANVGIQVHIHRFRGSSFRKELFQYDYDAVLDGWEDKENEPEYFYHSFFSCHMSQLTLGNTWCDLQYDAYVAEMTTTRNLEKIKILSRHAEQRIFEQIPMVPLTHSERILIVNKRVQNFKISSLQPISFEGVSILPIVQDEAYLEALEQQTQTEDFQ